MYDPIRYIRGGIKIVISLFVRAKIYRFAFNNF